MYRNIDLKDLNRNGIFCSVGDFYYFKNGLNKGKEFFLAMVLNRKFHRCI